MREFLISMGLMVLVVAAFYVSVVRQFADQPRHRYTPRHVRAA